MGKIAVITDIHYGLDYGRRLGSKAPRLMLAFARAVEKIRPLLIVDMGDRVTCKNADSDRHFMQSLKEHFSRLAAPVISLLGNHDVRHLSREENEEITGSPSSSHSMDLDGYHLIFWNPDVRYHGTEGLRLRPEDLAWLEADVENADKPCILFSHVPLVLDKPAKERSPHPIKDRFTWPESPKIQQMLERSGKVVLCMSGHRHKNRHDDINGIHYIIQQSFTNTWKENYRVPSRAFSILTLEPGKITFELMGKTREKREIAFDPARFFRPEATPQPPTDPQP